MLNKFFGKSNKNNYISYEDIQNVIKFNSTKYIIINTLDPFEQDCLIINTIISHNEENIINNSINNYDYDKHIIIYGKNCNDIRVEDKFSQINGLGFKNVYIYKGGLFEWLLLQDIYGKELFPTTKDLLDILKYKPINIL